MIFGTAGIPLQTLPRSLGARRAETTSASLSGTISTTSCPGETTPPSVLTRSLLMTPATGARTSERTSRSRIDVICSSSLAISRSMSARRAAASAWAATVSSLRRFSVSSSSAWTWGR